MKLIILLVVSLALALSSTALPGVPTSTVLGTVYDQNDNTVPYATVTVRCYEIYPGGMEGEMTTTADHHGSYLVDFPNDGSTPFSHCYVHSKIIVTAEKNGATGENNSTMESDYGTVVDVIIPDYQVPEFAGVALGLAIVGALVGFFILRKK